MHPKTVLNITWSDDFQPVLDRLNRAIEGGSNKHAHFYARALLRLLKKGIRPITTQDVACYVHDYDAPKGGWLHWDNAHWCNFGGPVVAKLKSGTPMNVLRA